MNDRTRIVVTGLGCRTSLGASAHETWAGLKEGRSGIGPITGVPLHDLKTTIAGEIKADVNQWIETRRISMFDRFAVLAVAAAREALEHSGLVIDAETAPRTGAIVGVAVCGWEAIENAYRKVVVGGARRADLFTVPRVMPSAPAGHVSMALGITGPVFGVTSACASSNHAILSGMHMIRSGLADSVLVGGTEAPLVYGVMKAWEALRILDPEACRPFSADRRGIVLGEGAGIVVLERLESARARGATIHAEIAGAGITADAGDLVTPGEDGPVGAIRQCLDDAGLAPGDIDYINAHGTATKANDLVESRAIHRVFASHVGDIAISSTKSMTGHTLGAAGAIELIACIGAIREGIIPPTINHAEPDPECDLDVTPNEPRQRHVDVALSNAFGFGGLNAVVAVRRFEA